MGIGDSLICTGMAKRAQEKDPRRVRILDRYGRHCWDQLWEGNPRIRKPTHGASNTQVVQCGTGARPYIDYARSNPKRWAWKQFDCPPGELYGITPDPRAADRILFDPTIKPRASPNKQWPHWQALVSAYSDMPWTQLCQPGVNALDGVQRIETATFRDACALIAGAAHLVTHEGGLHHAAAALGMHAVVLFAGFISPAQTGYLMHTNLFTGREPCGWRTPCEHCRKAMDEITPEMVMQALENKMSNKSGLVKFDHWYLPPGETHLQGWMTKKNQVVDGRLTYQYHKYEAAIALCKQRRTAIDVGAHAGLMSFWMARDFNHTHAFEPVAVHRECFEKNLGMDKNEKVTLWPIALGEKDDMVSMHSAPSSSGDTTVAGDGDIPLRRLDDCIPHDDIDYLKIDTEGMELPILRGAEKLLLRCKPIIMVEQKPGKAQQFGFGETDAVTYLQGLGYKVAKILSGDYILTP